MVWSSSRARRQPRPSSAGNFASTPSFAAQLVRSVLVDGAAAELTVVGGPQEFHSDLKSAADDLGVADRVRFAVDDPELRPAP